MSIEPVRQDYISACSPKRRHQRLAPPKYPVGDRHRPARSSGRQDIHAQPRGRLQGYGKSILMLCPVGFWSGDL